MRRWPNIGTTPAQRSALDVTPTKSVCSRVTIAPSGTASLNLHASRQCRWVSCIVNDRKWISCLPLSINDNVKHRYFYNCLFSSQFEEPLRLVLYLANNPYFNNQCSIRCARRGIPQLNLSENESFNCDSLIKCFVANPIFVTPLALTGHNYKW